MTRQERQTKLDERGRVTLPRTPTKENAMTAKELMAAINRLVAKRDRQQASLTLTINELAHWEGELDKLKKQK